MIHKGKILGFHGFWGSGLGFLTIEDSTTHELRSVPCDNGPTVRALEDAFGNVIGDAHDVKSSGSHIGKEIYWSYEEMGLILGGFTPARGATEKMKRLFKNRRGSK